MWDKIQNGFDSNKKVKSVRLLILKREFESMKRRRTTNLPKNCDHQGVFIGNTCVNTYKCKLQAMVEDYNISSYFKDFYFFAIWFDFIMYMGTVGAISILVVWLENLVFLFGVFSICKCTRGWFCFSCCKCTCTCTLQVLFLLVMWLDNLVLHLQCCNCLF